MASCDISIIIVSYNTKQVLDSCLNSIQKCIQTSTLRTEVIVVDNNSTDGTIEMMETKYPSFLTILNAENIGFGAANNLGILKSQGDVILLLNSDTVTIEGSIDRIYQYTCKHPRSFVGGKLYNVDRTPQSSCGPLFSLPMIFAALFLKGDSLGITRYSPNKPKRVGWVSGACIAAKKQVFTDNLLFDEGIFLYMEEIELFYRAKKKKIPVLFYPYARFIHIGAASSKKSRFKPVQNIYKGLTYVYKKHYGYLSQVMLRIMMKTKAVIAIIIGYITDNRELIEIYEKAIKLV